MSYLDEIDYAMATLDKDEIVDLSPDKIYLHDPLGSFKDDSLNPYKSVTWSEDRIDDSDVEYIKNNFENRN